MSALQHANLMKKEARYDEEGKLVRSAKQSQFDKRRPESRTLQHKTTPDPRVRARPAAIAAGLVFRRVAKEKALIVFDPRNLRQLKVMAASNAPPF